MSLIGLVPTFFRITAKQRPLPGYTGEIPSVTAACKISATSLKFTLTQLHREEENDQIVRD